MRVGDRIVITNGHYYTVTKEGSTGTIRRIGNVTSKIEFDYVTGPPPETNNRTWDIKNVAFKVLNENVWKGQPK